MKKAFAIRKASGNKRWQNIPVKTLCQQDYMLAERLEADGKSISEEIRAYESVVSQLLTKLAAKERTVEIAQQFAGYYRRRGQS